MGAEPRADLIARSNQLEKHDHFLTDATEEECCCSVFFFCDVLSRQEHLMSPCPDVLSTSETMRLRLPMKQWSSSELALASYEGRGFGDDHEFEKEELETVGELSKVCFHMVSQSFYLVRIGRPDMLWPACFLTRATTYAKFVISCINFMSSYRQICHVRHTALECRFGQFQDSNFALELTDTKSMSGGMFCIFRNRMLVPIGKSEKLRALTVLVQTRKSLAKECHC